MPDVAIADQVMLGEPAGLVDLVTTCRVDDLDGAPAHQRLRRGGHLLLIEPPADVPFDMRPVDGEGRLFQRMTTPRPDVTKAATGSVDRADSLARRQRQQVLVQDHINLARSLARRFAHRGESADDLEQVAFLALVKAARRFDPEHQAAFSTYATVSIQGELKRHFRDKTWMLRVPRSTQELYLSIRDTNQELGHELGRLPTTAETATHLGVDEARVLEAMQAGQTYTPASLDVCGPDGEQTIDIPVTDACSQPRSTASSCGSCCRDSMTVSAWFSNASISTGKPNSRSPSGSTPARCRCRGRWPARSTSSGGGARTTAPAPDLPSSEEAAPPSAAHWRPRPPCRRPGPVGQPH